MQVKVTIENTTGKVREAFDKIERRGLSRFAFQVMVDMKSSLQTAEGPSDPGEAPHTHPNILRAAIGYGLDDDAAVIGPRESIAGDVAQGLEFGGEFRGNEYEARPFVAPSLRRKQDSFAASFGGSSLGTIGE